MALGKFADVNLARTATLSGGAWSADLPLDNLKEDSRFVGAPARQEAPGTLASSRFDATLESPRALSLIAVLFHTLSLAAKYRLTVAGFGGTLADPVYQTSWLDVFPRMFATEELDYDEPNWWTGQLAEADLDLYPRHLWIPLSEPIVASAIRIELDDASNEAGYFDLGGLAIVSTWSPAMNFERGRELSMEFRDQEDEGPSGRLFFEERTPRRSLAVSWTMLQDAEARRLFDAGARARASRMVIFAPDLDDLPGLVREAFPATFRAAPAPQFTYPGLNRLSATLREIIA